MSSTPSESCWRWEPGQDGVRTLWFDQPGRARNVIGPEVIDELDSRLAEAEQDGETRGLLVRSAKPEGFCAGLDLDMILAADRSQLEAFVRRGTQVFGRLSSLRFPTAAIVHGACLGGGLDLALACGRRVALASSAPLQIGTPEVQYGLIPVWGSISRLPRLMGPDDGIELLISGRSIGYLLARSHHIVDRLAAETDVERPAELLPPAPAPERTWTKEQWETAWNRARAQIDEEPGEFPEAQLQILSILSIEIAHGSKAARQAIPGALAELAQSELTRDAITMLVRLRQVHEPG